MSTRSIELEPFVRRLHDRIQEPDCSIVWFLGAGCSISSGIPGASTLVRDWLRRLKRFEAGSEDGWEHWAVGRFENFDPANPALSYGEVIEELFLNLERDRQQEVERLTSGKDPSVGYAILARLMTHGEFGERGNVVLTTNFDDLVADALYLLTSQTPLVVVHDSLAPFVRQSKSRPLIVKLHGDARLAPRNTSDETNVIDKDLQSRLSGILHNCALVFCGYAGNDNSIAGLIDSASPEAFPLGIYWVGNELPSGPVASALDRRRRVFHIVHQDFDALMLTIAEVFDLSFPEVNRFRSLFDGYRAALTARASTTSDAGGLERDAANRLRDRIDVSEILQRATALRHDEPIKADALYKEAIDAAPRNVTAILMYAQFLVRQMEDLNEAEVWFQEAVKIDPRDVHALGQYGGFLHNARGDYDAAIDVYLRALSVEPEQNAYPREFAVIRANLAVLQAWRGYLDEARVLFDAALEATPNDPDFLVNSAQTLFALGNDAEAIERTERGLAVIGVRASTRLEANFYLYVHGSDRAEGARYLASIQGLLASGGRSPKWDFSLDIQRAERNDDRRLGFLRLLAAVINGRRRPTVLERSPEWAGQRPLPRDGGGTPNRRR